MPSESSHYLALTFIGQSVMAALWQNVQDNITIIAHSSLQPVSDPDNLSESVDSALEELGEESLAVKEVLFIVPYVWTDQGNLKSTAKDKLQTLSKDLLLEPMGFVILEEGLCSWQENLSGLAFNGLILQHQKEQLQVRLFIDGSLVSAFSLGKSDNFSNDLQELQARIKDYADQYQRIIYFDTSHQEQEYNQTVVILRQQLGQPVEKISPQQVAQIAVTAGGREVTGNSTVTPPTKLPATETPNNSSNQTSPEDNQDGFVTPDFVINKPASPTSLPEDATAVVNSQPSDNDPQHPVASNKKSRFKLPKFKLPSFNFPTGGKSKLAVIGITLVLILIMGLGGSWWYFRNNYTGVVKATLTPQQLQATTMIPLSTTDNEASSEAQQTLPAQTVTQSLTASTEVPTTGTKITGDPATGKITLFNKTDEEKTFSVGTPVYFNNLAFLLDEEVTIASASTQENRGSSTIDYGEKQVNVTAKEFGPDGNISKDEDLTVDNFGTDSYEAVSEEDFSGGTQREIQAVAQRDLDDALTELDNQIKDQLQTKFAEMSTADSPVFFSGNYQIDQRKQSAEVNEEAKFLTVSWEVTGEAYQVELINLVEIAQEIFTKDIQENFSLQNNSVNIEALELINADEDPTASAEVELSLKAEAVPDISQDDLKKQIANTYYIRAVEILEQQTGVKKAQATINPAWLTPFFKRLPNDPERIELNLKLE